MNKEMLETYSDYLLSSFSYTTATGLSMLVEGEISHDKITRFLRSEIVELEKRSSSLSKSEAKVLEDLRSAEIEYREYDKLMKDFADKQTEIDPDDGVKVNYAKFGGIITEI
ncbi:MAG: hypothetical protein AUK34_12615 [Ignavibacteria bacterium CG2_30_36_16]|nr:MAG: hypothetical protein AUK34_12615 [Ignavibacteria bacterium CG2_30_36_16]